MENRFELKGVSFKFSKKTNYFFRSLNVTFDRGALHFIQGANGVGKSTLFRVMHAEVGILESLEGTLLCNNKEYFLGSLEHAAIAHTIGLVEQQTAYMIADQFSFEENIQLSCMPRYPNLQSLPPMPQLPDFVTHIDLDYTKPAYLLSGGQRQILAITMMLLKAVTVLLLDEPTSALDEKNAELVMQFLHEIARNTPLIVIVISHDNGLVKNYCRDCYYQLYENILGERLIRTVDVSKVQ